MSIAVARVSGGWRTRTSLVLALSAAAVGLGSLWRFAALCGQYGGAPFVISYIACLFLITVPLLVAEVALGRHGRGGPVTAIRRASDRSLRSRGWCWLGVLACVAGLLVLTLYATVAGWSLAYVGDMQRGVFAAASLPEVAQHFTQLLDDADEQFAWFTLFLGGVMAVVALGVRRGLGMVGWVVLPALLALLGFLVAFAFEWGDLAATREFLFSVRWADFTPAGALAALAHACLTLGVGMGTGLCYGAYAPMRAPVGRSVLAVAVIDSMLAILAGLAIFPVVFAANLAPSMGPALLFVGLPYAFGGIAQGELFGAGVFVLLVLAAFGSAVAVMEPIVSTLMSTLRIGRLTAVLLTGCAVWLLGGVVTGALFRVGVQDWYGNRNLLGLLDVLTAQYLLPLIWLATALFVGWRLRPDILRLELAREPRALYRLWLQLLRYIVPAAALILLYAAGSGRFNV